MITLTSCQHEYLAVAIMQNDEASSGPIMYHQIRYTRLGTWLPLFKIDRAFATIKPSLLHPHWTYIGAEMCLTHLLTAHTAMVNSTHRIKIPHFNL
jgi:hypothetical protein